MGEFFKWAARHLALSIGFVVFAAVTLFGMAQDGYQLFQGLNGVPFQIVGAGGFMATTVAMLYRYSQGSGKAGDPAAPSVAAAAAKRRINREIDAAIYAGRFAIRRDVDDDERRKALPVLQSALATIRKEYGLEVVNLNDTSVVTITMGLRFIERIAPLLANGHVDEAKAAADDFRYALAEQP